MPNIEISIPSIPSGSQLECYSLSTTDFESYKIPLPPTGYKGGQSSDVLIYFKDLKEMEDYTSQIGVERNLSNSIECRTQKIQRIIDSIGLKHPLETMKERFYNKKFIDLNSGIPYRFIGSSLNISNKPHSEYSILENDGVFFMKSQLENSPVKIILDANTNVITLINDRDKVIANLQQE